jgi:hypothetical protein
MKPTQEMLDAERIRRNALENSRILLEDSKGPTCTGDHDEYLLQQSIYDLMIGSHAGRIGPE